MQEGQSEPLTGVFLRHAHIHTHKHAQTVLYEKLIGSPKVLWSHEDGEEVKNTESLALAQILPSVVQVGSKMLSYGNLSTQNSHSVCKPLDVADP